MARDFFISSTGNLISRLRLFSFRFHVGKNTNQRRPRHRWCQIKHSWFSNSNSIVINNGRAVRSNTPPSLRHRWRCYKNVFLKSVMSETPLTRNRRRVRYRWCQLGKVWDTANSNSARCEILLIPARQGVRHGFCRLNGASDTADTYIHTRQRCSNYEL